MTHLMLSPVAAREGDTMRRMSPDEYPPEWYKVSRPPFETWISRAFLAQLFNDRGGVRVTVNRTTFDVRTKQAIGGISWDELQEIKRQIGRGDVWAVELYPPDGDVVNTANMRHLWLLDAQPAYGWDRDHR